MTLFNRGRRLDVKATPARPFARSNRPLVALNRRTAGGRGETVAPKHWFTSAIESLSPCCETRLEASRESRAARSAGGGARVSLELHVAPYATLEIDTEAARAVLARCAQS
jgi:hypothetical protein